MSQYVITVVHKILIIMSKVASTQPSMVSATSLKTLRGCLCYLLNSSRAWCWFGLPLREAPDRSISGSAVADGPVTGGSYHKFLALNPLYPVGYMYFYSPNGCIWIKLIQTPLNIWCRNNINHNNKTLIPMKFIKKSIPQRMRDFFQMFLHYIQWAWPGVRCRLYWPHSASWGNPKYEIMRCCV